MTTIETEHGTFTADTLAEASKAARAAARAKKRELQAEAELAREARVEAMKAGFAIHQQVARARRMGDGKLYLCEPHRATGVQVVGPCRWSSLGGHRVTYGDAVYEHDGYEVVAVIVDLCGWFEGVITREVRTGEEAVLAVGTASREGHRTAVEFVCLEIEADELRRLAGEVITP